MFQPPDRRRIYLMRHAEAAYVQQDGTLTLDSRQVGLTALGREQARKQAAVLASIPFDRAICSGLRRTRETAALILAGREAPPLEIEPALEEIRPGNREAPQTDIDAWLRHVANPWATAAEDPDARFIGGERFADFDARVRPAFERIASADGWRHLLLVLHGAVNRTILNAVLNLPWQGRTSIEQDNCCINIIDLDRDKDGAINRYLLRTLNLTGYNLNKSGITLTTMEQGAKRLSEMLAKQDE